MELPCFFFFCFFCFTASFLVLLPSPFSAAAASPSSPSIPGPASSPSPAGHHPYSSRPSQDESGAPGPAPSPELQSDEDPPSPAPYSPDPDDENEEEEEDGFAPDARFRVKWCAVRDDISDCEYYISLLETGSYHWSCVRKESAKECLEAVRAKEADVVALDAGLAYIALMNYSMKAIAAEEYCYHRRAYEAVAVVPRAECERNPELNLADFRGKRSCHPGYRTGAGWDYPVRFILDNGLQELQLPDESDSGYGNGNSSSSSIHGDESIVGSFFSQTCAPSEFEGTGLCTSCGSNGSCVGPASDPYRGYSGAFRCLVEDIGDVAFLRSDTALRLSQDGMNARNWSTKTIDEFRYLCPTGGCKTINDNIGGCSFGSVPSNLIMTFNSQTNKKRNAIVRTLLNASWIDAVYSGNNSEDHVFSASTQDLVELKELTRSYLGTSAIIAQSVLSVHSDNSSSTLSNNGNGQPARFSFWWLVCSIVPVVLGGIHSPVL